MLRVLETGREPLISNFCWTKPNKSDTSGINPQGEVVQSAFMRRPQHPALVDMFIRCYAPTHKHVLAIAF